MRVPTLAKILLQKLLVTESRARWLQEGNIWGPLKVLSLEEMKKAGGWMAGTRLGPVGWLKARGGWIESGTWISSTRLRAVG